jgi:zinc transporter 2
MSFGYHRAEVIGALGSVILIWGLTILLFYEATVRILDKTIVKEPLIMLITAGFGLFCNLVMGKILHSSPGHSHAGHDHGHDHGHGHGHSHGHSHGGHGHNHGSNDKKKKAKISMQ